MRRYRRAMLGLLTVAAPLCAAAAIGSGCSRGEYPLCRRDQHCRQEDDEVCVGGLCENCRTDADCEPLDDGTPRGCFAFRCEDMLKLPVVCHFPGLTNAAACVVETGPW